MSVKSLSHFPCLYVRRDIFWTNGLILMGQIIVAKVHPTYVFIIYQTHTGGAQ
jgi:hypothetical protein